MKGQTFGAMFVIASALVLASAFAVRAGNFGGDSTEDLVLCCKGSSVAPAAAVIVQISSTECLADEATANAVNSCPYNVLKCETFYCQPHSGDSMETWGSSWKGVPKDCTCVLVGTATAG